MSGDSVKSLSAVFIGEQSLLIQCAEHWLKCGHEVRAVVAENSSISDWCEAKGLRLLSPRELPRDTYAEQLSTTPYDYLFSITNLRILPTTFITQPKKMAINFHDGPLPRYAGLNVPAWALLHGEQNHGVTFHAMTHEVDKGDILQQKLFPIVAGETAFTLNAKCYQMAVETFTALTADLSAGNLLKQKQSRAESNPREHSYFNLGKKPYQAAILDFTQSAPAIDRLVRAMDYGTYACPLSYPKLYIGDNEFVIVRKALLVDRQIADANAQVGNLLAISTDGLTIATTAGAIQLSEMVDLAGHHQCPVALSERLNWHIGTQLPQLPAEAAETITELDQAYGKHESYWRRRLRYLEPLELPYAKQPGANQPSEIKAASEAGIEPFDYLDQALPASVLGFLNGKHKPADTLLALFALYLSRVGRKSSYDLALQTAAFTFRHANTLSVFAECIPLTVTVNPAQNITSYLDQQIAALDILESRGGFNMDLYLREPELHHVDRCKNLSVQIRRPTQLGLLQLGHACGTQNSHQLMVDIADEVNHLRWNYRSSALAASDIQRMQEQFTALLIDLLEHPDKPVGQLNLLCNDDKQRLFGEWNTTTVDYPHGCIHQLFEQQAERTPEHTALVFENHSLTYKELNERANQLARYLLERGAGRGRCVGVLVDRSLDMVVSLLAVLKTGSAYVPLDPVYPRDRLVYMVEDSGVVLVICNAQYAAYLSGVAVPLLQLESAAKAIAPCGSGNVEVDVQPEALAYLIYTSGSTGQPKGVMVEHRNLMNFFIGMDSRVDNSQFDKTAGVWLAVTSISFDISVLEIFWTLARGFKVVLYADDRRQKSLPQTPSQKNHSSLPQQHIDFSLFFWNVATEESLYQTNKYGLLLDAARFADNNQFKAVWTPERHFAAFGGNYPNPAITSAAIAAITTRVEIRAGSCVTPLHNPIRLAEDWAMVDNLSNGRVGMAVAAGWAPPDFAIIPENFSNAKQVMIDNINIVNKLWSGERVTFPGPTGDVAVRTLPRPIQAKLPIWMTTAGNIDSYKRAAEMGANVLTHLLGQTIEDVQLKIQAYRDTWKTCGHPGEGKVTLMLHTFIGPDKDTIQQQVRGPFKEYLRSSASLVKDAAWNFSTFKKLSSETGKTLDDFFANITEQDMDALLEFAFQRYFTTSGLFGTVADGIEMVDKCKRIGVDEVACLIDFGIKDTVVLEHLTYLNQLREKCVAQSSVQSSAPATEEFTIPALMQTHQVSHLQCTPSMASMLAADPLSRTQLAKLKQLMVGGEAFPATLALDLHTILPGKVTNMYGPTETTVWSSTYQLEGKPGAVPIGRPIANTQIYIVDENLQPLPVGVAGELIIAGDGVVRGYHNRADLNHERFFARSMAERFSGKAGARMYRTGDLAKFLDDVNLAYLGRIDQQVKIRGYRIELGEIESLLRAHQDVREAVVLLREDIAEDKRLVAYLQPHAGQRNINTEQINHYMTDKLPSFMVPFHYIELAAMPLTPNGKIDRKALPAPQAKRRSSGGALVVPQNDSERLIAEIWQNALGISEVGINDNFFDIGGHSLLVIKVLADLNNHAAVTKPIQLTDLFRYTTITAIAQFLASDKQDSSGVNAGEVRANARKSALVQRRNRARLPIEEVG